MRLRRIKFQPKFQRPIGVIFCTLQTVLAITVIIIQTCIIVYLVEQRNYESVIVSSNNCAAFINQRSDGNRTIIVITPTYLRLARLADMTRLSQTLMHINQLIWIVVEDAKHISLPVKQLLDRSRLQYYYFAIKRRPDMPARGWTGRDAGLKFVRERFASLGNNAVVFFADDDNTYDIRLFNHYIRNVDKIGVWAVGTEFCSPFSHKTYSFKRAKNVLNRIKNMNLDVCTTGLVAYNMLEAPKVFAKKIIGWQTIYAPRRKWGFDMAGFAVNLELLLQHPEAGWRTRCPDPSPEPCLMNLLNVSWNDLTPFGMQSWPRDVLVWHTKTIAKVKSRNTYGYNVEVPPGPFMNRTESSNIEKKGKNKKILNGLR
uniref:Galactosylgalactosylxylosylprotein 3-beta-glucuronosyltransferase n=1 Tax=Setaria digitata TaxID=48799 RepID=A0A915PSU9_9BILA